ncbi:MAG: AI-2E family transporter, partial [Candidatus Ornithospirochaeta sp.]
MDKNVKGVIYFVGVFLFIALMKIGASIVLPLMIAVFIFILVNPVMERLEKMHVPSVLAMTLVLLMVSCICIIFVYLLFAMVNMILAKLPEYISKVARFDDYISSRVRDLFNVTNTEFPSVITMLNIDWVGQLKSVLTSISSTSVSIMGDVAMIILYLMFLLMERSSIFPKVAAAFPESRTEAEELVRNISHQT